MFDKNKIKIISLILILILLPVEFFGITLTFCQTLDSNHKIMVELKGKCCMEMEFEKTANNDKNHSQNIKDECCKKINYNISNVVESNKISPDQLTNFKVETILTDANPAKVFLANNLNLISFDSFRLPFIEKNSIIQLI